MASEAPGILESMKFLTGLGDGVHWLCPRGDPATAKGDQSMLKRKTNATVHCMELFTDPEGTGTLEWFKSKIVNQFQCQYCVRNWHTAKKDIRKKYEGEYDLDILDNFIDTIDAWDEERIFPIINEAVKKLRAPNPEKKIPFDVVGSPALVALYDCLYIPNVLEKQHLFGERFREAFIAIQMNGRHMRMADVVPAFTAFLFGPHQELRIWATKCLAKLPKSGVVAADDYELWLQPHVEKAVHEASFCNDAAKLELFWSASTSLIKALDKATIVKYICGSNHDLIRMAVSHLQQNSSQLRFILQLFKVLLEKLKLDFWDAIGSMPPVVSDVLLKSQLEANFNPKALMEIIFNNPKFDELLLGINQPVSGMDPVLEDLTAWVIPLVISLQLSTRVPSCASLLFQLFERLQESRFPLEARSTCTTIGLKVLYLTIQDFSDKPFEEDDRALQGNRIIAREAISITENRFQTIMKAISNPRASDASTARDILGVILKSECRLVLSDFKLLTRDTVEPPEATRYSTKLWEKLYDEFLHNNYAFAHCVISNVSGLVGLEKFTVKPESADRQAKLDFNKTLGHLKASIANFLNRMSEYDADILKRLFTDGESSKMLIASLFDPYQENYHAAVDLVKQAFGTLGKVEALRGLFMEYFIPTMKALDESIRQIRDLKTFTPMPRLLKTCDNILEIFCSPQKGLIPLKLIPIEQTQKLLFKQFWKTQWINLGIIFDRSVRWSQIIEKEIMVEFTRDVMEYADKLFSEFTIFEQVFRETGDAITIDLTSDGNNKISAQGEDLLSDVSAILEKIVSWLRLRDEALLRMCQALACKMLARLYNSSVKPPQPALDMCINLAQGLKKRYNTNMSDEQKAELMRAANLHLGIIDVAEDLSDSATTKDEPNYTILKQEPNAVITKEDPDMQPQPPKRLKVGVIDLDTWKAKADSLVTTKSGGVAMKAESQTTRKFIPLVEAVPKRPMPSTSRPPPKRPVASSGGSSLMKDLKAGVRSDVRARNAIAASLPQKSMTVSAPAGQNLQPLKVEVPVKLKAPTITQIDDSSDASSEDDNSNALFSFATRSVKSPEKRKKTQIIDDPRRLFAARAPLTEVAARKVQSLGDVRARLTPDLTSLYRRIMGWDFFHTGPFPPDSGKKDYTMVQKVFDTAEQYAATFEPLLMLECWQQIVKAKDESNYSPFEIKVVTRLAADNFVEIQTTVSGPVMTANGFGQSDVVLITFTSSPLTTATNATSCLARVHSLVRKPNHVELSLRCLPNNNLLSAVRPNSTLQGLKIMSLTPLEREYGALKGLKYYDLRDQIIKARPHAHHEASPKQVFSTMRTYNVNEPQAKAIIGAVQNEGFSLIQGPPGTGKTKTVVGIVGALLTIDKGIAIAKPGAIQASSPVPILRKLLVCAPSNAAVDELVIRFKDGVFKTTGEKFIPSIVRLGKSDSINAAVRDVTLEELVDRKINQELEKTKGTDNGIKSDPEAMRTEMKQLLEERDGKRLALDHARAEEKEFPTAIRKEVDELSAKIRNLGRQLDESRDQRQTVYRNKDIRRLQYTQEVLDNAHILCATLSGSGHEMLKNLKIEFETVIIDEAAQSIELSALIPLKYGCRKCILVGDPKQLPPTVLSREASRFQYEQSLFVRMQVNHPKSVYLLSIQYRMHPEISSFPSAMFYDSQLIDGPGMEIARQQIWHDSTYFGPYRFFNVAGQEQKQGHSTRNVTEIAAAIAIYNRLTTDFQDVDFNGKIGIITPYKTQLMALKDKFRQQYGPGILDTIDFNTTDAFQGREREIIIFSCVRASPSGSIGFLQDVRRMNVGLTRAKSSLFVLGNADTLQKDEFWGQLVVDAKKRDRFSQDDVKKILSRPSRTHTMQMVQKMEDIQISPSIKPRKSSTSSDMRRKDSTDMEIANSVDPMSRKSSITSDSGTSRLNSTGASNVGSAERPIAQPSRPSELPKRPRGVAPGDRVGWRSDRDRPINIQQSSKMPPSGPQAMQHSNTNSPNRMEKNSRQQPNTLKRHSSFDKSDVLDKRQKGLEAKDVSDATDHPKPPKASVPVAGIPIPIPDSNHPPRPRPPPPGSRGPLPPRKKKNAEDAMFIKRKR